ncbi:MAG: 2-C-methyl-D-erythritol 4-phosphate cytidylyltransferase [Blautia sp.]|nr:2-C-methyl-D-erythritol 4-phosphate cytidylyltransferase [Blautia sp.]
MNKLRCSAVVLAAGQGKRMNSKVQKQFLELHGRPIVFYSLECFQKSDMIDEIILVTGQESIQYCRKEIVERYGLDKVRAIVAGGSERYNSVYNGLLACNDPDYVFIHDGARPFIDQEMLKRGLEGAMKTGACVIGMPSKDTVKIADACDMVKETPERSRVWIIQTPQIFDYSLVRNAHESLRNKDMTGITDDAMVIEQETDVKVCLAAGSYMNIKITTPEDLKIAGIFCVDRYEKE